MKNLKKIKLKEGDQVLDDLQLKKIVGGAYVNPWTGGPDEGMPFWAYCGTVSCSGADKSCPGLCRCDTTKGRCVADYPY